MCAVPNRHVLKMLLNCDWDDGILFSRMWPMASWVYFYGCYWFFMDVTDFYSLNLLWKHSQTDLNFILMCSLFVTINLMGKVRDLFMNNLLCSLWCLLNRSVQTVQLLLLKLLKHMGLTDVFWMHGCCPNIHSSISQWICFLTGQSTCWRLLNNKLLICDRFQAV